MDRACLLSCKPYGGVHDQVIIFTLLWTRRAVPVSAYAQCAGFDLVSGKERLLAPAASHSLGSVEQGSPALFQPCPGRANIFNAAEALSFPKLKVWFVEAGTVPLNST